MLDIALLALSPLATLQGVAAKVDPLDAIVAEAERDAREGRYDKARAAYQMLAKKHPETIQGILGAKRSRPSAYLGWAPVKESGPSANRVDIVFMGDGWEWQNLKAFDKLAEDAANELARNEVVREYAAYFNFHRAVLVSAQNGVDGFGRDYDTPLGARTLETFAGHVGIDQAKVREVLSEFPAHDGQAIVFVKNGVLGTGGSGVAVIGGREMGTMVHEFGHSFVGLHDEYQTQTGHGGGGVPNSLNVASFDDPNLVPWAHWIAAKHPQVGVHEGAASRVKGAWRPTTSGCIMENGEDFCVVCREALVLRIYQHVDPIESCNPEPQSQRTKVPYPVGPEGFVATVQAMRPARHNLEVEWYLLHERSFAQTSGGIAVRDDAGGAPARQRLRKGRTLPSLQAQPVATSRGKADGLHRYVVQQKDLEPGVWRILCRVKDTTVLRADKFPWVLKDDDSLLSSERGWWIEVPPR
jgi:hypothetical protein